MRLELIRNFANKIVGYKMIKEPHDDTETFERVRDMYYWNMGEQVLVYDGRSADEDTNATKELRFATKEHKEVKTKQYDEYIIYLRSIPIQDGQRLPHLTLDEWIEEQRNKYYQEQYNENQPLPQDTYDGGIADEE